MNYKKEMIQMINRNTRSEVLRYIYIIIADIYNDLKEH